MGSHSQAIKFCQGEEQPDCKAHLHNPAAGLMCFSQREYPNKKKKNPFWIYLDRFMLQVGKTLRLSLIINVFKHAFKCKKRL